MLGLAVHVKLYPIIYSLPLYLAIDSLQPPASSPAQQRSPAPVAASYAHHSIGLSTFFSRERLLFTTGGYSSFSPQEPTCSFPHSVTVRAPMWGSNCVFVCVCVCVCACVHVCACTRQLGQ